MGVIKCSQCGKLVPDKFAKCPKCGNALSVVANDTNIEETACKSVNTTQAEVSANVETVFKQAATNVESTLNEVATSVKPTLEGEAKNSDVTNDAEATEAVVKADAKESIECEEPAQMKEVVQQQTSVETNVSALSSTSSSSSAKGSSNTKRLVVRLASTLFALALIVVGAIIILGGSGSDDDAYTYTPWSDLNMYFDINQVVHEEDFSHFNSYEITANRLIMNREHPSEEQYSAVVLGTGVWVRSYPRLQNRTKRCQVDTGDRLLVTRIAGYSGGEYWSYAEVLSGRRAGKKGYIANDYIIEQDKYDVLDRYVLNGNSNMNIYTPSKYLNAIATVLLKLNAHQRNLNLDVNILDTMVLGQHTVVTYQIYDRNVAKNASLLAVVLFFDNNNDYIVIGVVPGSDVNHIVPNVNGSYDIYFVR